MKEPRHRLRLLVSLGMAFSTVVLGFILWLHHRENTALLAMLLLAASYVGPIAVLFTERPRLINAVQLGCAVLSSASLGVFALQTGGAQSLAFLGTLAVPLALGLLCRETPLVSLLAGLTTAVIGGYTMAIGGRDASDVFVVAGMGLSAGLVGTYGTFMYRRLQEAELHAERERSRVLEELAMLQRQGAEAERLATVGRLAAGVAHEINNPLAFISANLEFIKRAVGKQQAELDDVLAEADEGLRRIRNIVSDLTELARPATQAQESCDPAGSIETAVRIASVKAKGIASFTVEAQSEPPAIAMSGARLVQVLVNLLINAVDAIEAGPKRASPGTVWIQLLPGKLVVADDGPGISPQVRERLFEPFFTTKPAGKGTGLGLALCRQYLSERGFSIAVDERPGGGARFTLSLSAPGATATTTS